MKSKIIRITTVPVSLEKLLSGQLRFMGDHFEVIAVSSDEKGLKKVGETENCTVFPLEMTRQITPIKDLLAVIKLYFFLRKTKPGLVHTHTPKAGIVGMLAAKLAGVPVRLHTVAGLPLLEATGIKRKILNFVEKLTYRCATKVYPNSYGLADIIRELEFCPDSKLKVIANGSSNGIDTAHFNPNLFSENQKSQLRTQWAIGPDDFVFLFVGRLVKDKGLEEMVAAFGILQEKYIHSKLLLVGGFEPDLDPLSPQTIAAIQHNPAIIQAGFQTDVRPYFALSDCLVFPSYREGFPNVVMQAGAMELPCIVSDINGCNEIIAHGKNGIIIPVKDAIALGESMEMMISDRDFLMQMKANCREVIRTRYEQKLVWEALLSEYRTFGL